MKILLLANSISGLLSFRKEVIQAIVDAGNIVVISAPPAEDILELSSLGVSFLPTKLNRRSTNPLKDIGLIAHYIKSIRATKPDLILSYTIKPNIYGGIAAQITRTDQIANITGLGTAVENGGILQKFLICLYRIGLRKVKKVFFQNFDNRSFCLNHKMVPNRTVVIPGSGVNLNRFQVSEYPVDNVTRFLYIGRLMANKGTSELFEVARRIKEERKNVEFHIIGSSEENYDNELRELVERNIITYHGTQRDVRPFISSSNALLHPSYHEGMSNVILESSAMGRPIITTTATGCRDAVEDGKTGLIAEVRNADDLYLKLTKFIDMPWKEKKEMGLAARRKMEHEFDRRIVVDAYMSEISPQKACHPKHDD